MSQITFDFTNVPQEDIEKLTKEFNQKISWIASGARDRSIYYEELEKKLKKWSNEQIAILKEAGIPYTNTTYSCWECTRGGVDFKCPYVLNAFNNSHKIESEADFVIGVYDYRGKGGYIGRFHSAQEAIDAYLAAGYTLPVKEQA